MHMCILNSQAYGGQACSQPKNSKGTGQKQWGTKFTHKSCYQISIPDHSS